MTKKITTKAVAFKKQAPKKANKKTGLKTLLSKVLKPSSKKKKYNLTEPNAPIVLQPNVLKFKRHKYAYDYLKRMHLAGWKIFENKIGGFYLYKKHFELLNELNKERQTLDTMKALALGFGSMLMRFNIKPSKVVNKNNWELFSIKKRFYKLNKASNRYRVCPNDSVEFMAPHRSMVFCCRWCANEYHNEMKRTKKNIIQNK